MLVTRPEPGASATARRLSALGHAPLVLPLSELRGLSPRLPPAAEVDAVAFTSASALRLLDRSALAPFLEGPCFAVGSRTADAARAAGFADVRAGEGDGQALADLVAEALPPGGRVLYPCGRPRRPEFERRLEAAGLACLAVEVYEAVFPPVDAAAIARVTSGGPVDFALLHSPAAAHALSRALATPDTAGFFEKTSFLCLSRRIAESLSGPPAARIRWCQAPDDGALMALLPPA